MKACGMIQSFRSAERKRNENAFAFYCIHFIASSYEVATRVSDEAASAPIIDIRIGPLMSGASEIQTASYRPKVIKP